MGILVLAFVLAFVLVVSRENQTSDRNASFKAFYGAVNGAGLAMATMDIIQLHGGTPANFLDLGGGVQEEGVFQAFNIVSKDERVKSILVNIFGGIVDCRIVANGITDAYRSLNLKLPVVVRLEGTNVGPALEILKQSGMPLIPAGDMDEAAKKAVQSLAN